MKKLFCFLFCLLFYIFCLNRVSKLEVGVSKNILTGELETQSPGWHLTSPIKFVTYVDTLPTEIQGFSFTKNSLLPKRIFIRVIPGKEKAFIEDVGFYVYKTGALRSSYGLAKQPDWLEVVEK